MTRPIRIAQIADIHLGAALTGIESDDGAPVVDPVETAYLAFVRLLGAVHRANVDGVVIAGDVFDRSVRSDRALQTFQCALDEFHDAGLPTAIISGNHDVDAQLARRVRVASSAQWLDDEEPHTVIWDQLGIALHGQSVGHHNEHRDLADGYPPPVAGLINIGVLHTSLHGRWSRRDCAPTSLSTLERAGYDAWALGHVHQRKRLATTPFITYSGSVHARRPSETGGHGFVVLEFGAGNSVTPIDTAPVRYETAAIAGPDPTDTEISNLRTQLSIAALAPELVPELVVITVPDHTSETGIEQTRAAAAPYGNVLVRAKSIGVLQP